MKKKKSGGGGANWMDTYGDMVTLLLCFFVLLYSMSTISEEKWKALVQSFNPGAVDVLKETSGNDGPIADPITGELIDDPGRGESEQYNMDDLPAMQEEIDEAIQELYQALQNYVNENGLEQSIVVTKGDGYVFISFNDAVFFAGDSYVLLEQGRDVLDVVSDALIQAAPYVDEVRIMGHTAQAEANVPNHDDVDRFLASNRATVAVVYIQERVKEFLSPARLVSVGYGQHRPIDRNDTEEHRAHNRRVEILITGLDLFNQFGDSIQQYQTLRTGELEIRTDVEANVDE